MNRVVYFQLLNPPAESELEREEIVETIVLHNESLGQAWSHVAMIKNITQRGLQFLFEGEEVDLETYQAQDQVLIAVKFPEPLPPPQQQA